MPRFLELKDDLATLESRIEKLRADVDAQKEAIEWFQEKSRDIEESIREAERGYRKEMETWDNLKNDRAKIAAEKKQDLELRSTMVDLVRRSRRAEWGYLAPEAKMLELILLQRKSSPW
ncbi:hypothetical protein R1sor_003296 [Riccia sorocarpa]|uniref:Uncharacterized protein n=1 Tax=Riccia sorocarpa TaxID=122646 RepID=A0ABD3H408_9MARC